MTTFTRVSSIALISFATLTGCGGGGGGGGGGAAAPAPVVGVGDIVIDAFTVVFSPTESVFTSFEFTMTAPFSIGGTPPFTADFLGGQALTRGNPALYEEGDFAWHIFNNTSATVTFGTPPSALEFFVLTENTTGIRTVEIFDVDGASILTVTPMNAFERVEVIRTPGQTLIGDMVVTNTPP
jgi:hypothetical protein